MLLILMRTVMNLMTVAFSKGVKGGVTLKREAFLSKGVRGGV
jgi:hypothetical protein